MIRPKIGLDWDDVTAPFNSIAIDMANKKYNITPPLELEDIDSWENTGRASVIKEFYRDNTLYERQKPTEETKRMIRKLMDIGEVYFITAVAPGFMGVRASQIMEAFPDFPTENIILGNTVCPGSFKFHSVTIAIQNTDHIHAIFFCTNHIMFSVSHHYCLISSDFK